MPINTYLDELSDELNGHFINIIHHANTKAFANAFFPALGWGFGLLPALVLWSLLQ